MLRRVVVLALLTVLLAACQDEAVLPRSAPPPTARPVITDPYWSVPTEDAAARAEQLRRVRAIAPCALVSRAELATIGTVLAISPDGLDSCEAVLDSTELTEATIVRLIVSMSWPGREVTPKPDTTIRSGDVTLGEARAVSDAPAGSPSKEASCGSTGAFASGLRLIVTITGPGGAEPCPRSNAVLDTALTRWQERPGHDAPEAVATRGRAVYRKHHSSPQFGALLEQPLPTAALTDVGPRYPAVTVDARDPATAEEVIRLLLTEL